MAMQSAVLDLTFKALSDETRRTIVRSLSKSVSRTAAELGAQIHSAQPTISKHLKVLEEARLVERVVQGRVHHFRLERSTLGQAERWIARHRELLSGAVDQREQLLWETDDEG